MLIQGNRLIGMPIMSLQTGGEIGRTIEPVINPADLQILAYQIAGPLLGTTPTYIRIDDIRELAEVGFIVDSIDETVVAGDIIQLDDILARNFSLISRPVITQNKRKLGRVIDFTLDTDQFIVMQLSVKRPLFRSLSDTELLIHRSEIVEINNAAIVVKDDRLSVEQAVPTTGSYHNPFRSAQPSADGTSSSSTTAT